MATQEEMLWLIDDTEKYYLEDVNRRCVDDSEVCYYSPDSAGKQDISDGCAIGRWMSPKQKLEAGDNKYTLISVTSLPERLIPDKLKGFTREFLQEIQLLHDLDGHWNDTGVSRMGKGFIKNLKDKVQSGVYDQ
jgi:hypothetical protein